MSNFAGYLLKFGSNVLPNKYLLADTFSVTPDHRTELEAYRDNNNLLHRTTSPNTKTEISFDLVPMTLEDKIIVQNIIANSMINFLERKCLVYYWNDESNCYFSGEFYIPDVTYPIQSVTSKTIKYNSISYTLIEY